MNCNNVPWITFMNGERAPGIGLGTYDPIISGKKVREAVMDAICAGYRHFDCAMVYKNEEEIGNAICLKIMDGTIRRQNIFVTGKLWNTFHHRNFVEDGFKISLEDIKLTYLDLYLMNMPTAFAYCGGLQPMDTEGNLLYSDVPFTETWKGMERLVEDDLVKLIGVSNFNCKQLLQLLESARIKPVVNQIESHPYLPQSELKEVCESRGILIEAYAPLGSSCENEFRGDEPVLLEDSDVQEIAKKHGKTSANVLIKYQIQRGAIVLPKSFCKEHIVSNINVFDFALDDEDMQILGCLAEKNIRYHSYFWLKDHPDYPFNEKLEKQEDEDDE